MYNMNYAPTTSGYKVEEKIHLGVRERKMLNVTVLEHVSSNWRVPSPLFIVVCKLHVCVYERS